jgi:cysteine desulfurase family protein (TIGR01976 family)
MPLGLEVFIVEVDLAFCRSQFPALQQTSEHGPLVYLDGPGGTQVPKGVIDAVANYLAFENSNTHGSFLTSRRTDERLQQAREAMADFLGAQPSEIALGNNMTTLNYALSRALGRGIGPGDRVVITDLDHEANRGPWLALAEKGAEVVSVAVRQPSCTLDMDDMRRKISGSTRLVAAGHASNAAGTINDVKTICGWAREAGAVSVIDAVHYAAHGPIDVKEIGCDFLVCSAYKFFGPHVGVLYGRADSFDMLKTYKLLPQDEERPYKIETGTLNHEGIAGIPPAVEFIAGLGDRFPGLQPRRAGLSDRRRRVLGGMKAIHLCESRLAQRLWSTLKSLPSVQVYGPDIAGPRCPTFSFTLEGARSDRVAAFLGERGIFVWDGDFYATTLVKVLGLEPKGGLVRVGLAPYNTAEEIDRLGAALQEFVAGIEVR